jgi:uncharacterized membrane protein
MVRVVCLIVAVAISGLAYAGPRSGSSFGGLRGFRSGSGSSGSLSRGLSGSRNYGGGSSFVFLPSFGWGWGGFGYGGGMGIVGTLMLVGIVGVGTVMVVRSIRRASRRSLPPGTDYDEYDDVSASVGRCYVHKVQLGLGRSGRGVQKRLDDFATTGDTSSEAGLAELLRQTALELMREKDSIRYALADASGPFSLTNGESKMTGAAMAERSRFQIERVRGAEGQTRRSEAASTVGSEALEFLVVTILVATRASLAVGKAEDRQSVEAALAALGGVAADNLLGLEVIWTPADPEDSLTETDLMTTYPDMRSV